MPKWLLLNQSYSGEGKEKSPSTKYGEQVQVPSKVYSKTHMREKTFLGQIMCVCVCVLSIWDKT